MSSIIINIMLKTQIICAPMTKNGDHLKSIFHPTAPPKPRPASSLNQTLVQGLGEAERDQTRRNNLL